MKELRLSSLLLCFILSACSQQAPQQASLGELNTGIVGGVPVGQSEDISKSTVAIGSPLQGVFCTGVLVAKNLVLTAAHCTGVTERPTQMFIIFGVDLNGELQTRRVLGGKVPDQWPQWKLDQEMNHHDVALLKFQDEAPAGFVPARLLGNKEHVKNGMAVTLVGYGKTSMEPEIDPGKMMKADVVLTDAQYSDTEILFNLYDGKAACHGDSGGPAFAVINNKLFVIGVTSRSSTFEGGMTCLDGAVYTSVPAQVEFLRQAARYLNSKNFVPNQVIPQPNPDEM